MSDENPECLNCGHGYWSHDHGCCMVPACDCTHFTDTPADITVYPHQCEGLKTLHPGAEVNRARFVKNENFYYYNGITTYVDVLYCPGCGGRCL